MNRKDSIINRRLILVAIFIVLICGISFGYAQLRETLSINGKTNIKAVKWDVNLRNLQLDNEDDPTMSPFLIDSNNIVEIKKGDTIIETLSYDVDDENNPIVTVVKNSNEGGDKIHFKIKFSESNKRFSFKFDISNNGTLNAILDKIKEDNNYVNQVTNNVEEKVSDEATEIYFKYTVYGMPSITASTTKNLPSGTKRTVTITMEFPEVTDSTNLPTDEFIFERTISLEYIQK